MYLWWDEVTKNDSYVRLLYDTGIRVEGPCQHAQPLPECIVAIVRCSGHRIVLPVYAFPSVLRAVASRPELRVLSEIQQYSAIISQV